MSVDGSAHSREGLHRILELPPVYNLLFRVIGKRGKRQELVDRFVRPFESCRILEVGCGTGNLLEHLPVSIGEYVGFDMNPSYIAYAARRWRERENCRFHCGIMNDDTLTDSDYYDIVVAWAVLHHLNDGEAMALFRLAHHALKPTGDLVTYDAVSIPDQRVFAKWLIARDRGASVRTEDEYLRLARDSFANVEGETRHDVQRVPYSVFIMRCEKGS